mgnify:CR=1 FL=1
MGRGRLIFPFLAVIARLDVIKSSSDPDGAGELDEGYDHVLREPHTYTNTSGVRQDTRQDKCILVPCQIEDRVLEGQRQIQAGNNPQSIMTLVFHFRDLERLGLVDRTTGMANIRPNDRLDRLLHCRTKKLVQSFRNPPGLFAVSCTPAGFGIGNARNLLLCVFEEREQGVTA